MTKMDPEVKARWVAALRSGEYRQTKESLKDSRGHCCLGVLCDLYAKEAGRSRWGKDLSSKADGDFSTHNEDKGIPCVVVGIWSGLDTRAVVLIGGDEKPLYAHNDDGCTFAEIADAIESQL